MHVVRFASREGKVEPRPYRRGVADARRGSAVEIVVAVGGVAVVVAADEVDIGRETAVGVSLRILVMPPSDLEVAVLAVGIGVAAYACLGDTVTDIEESLVFVSKDDYLVKTLCSIFNKITNIILI